MFTWYEYVIIGAYILAILGIGAWMSRKGSENMEEYYLGGKSMPWWMLGISFMTSNLDLTGTMVIGSFFALVGMKGFLVELRGGTALPLALFMIFMAKWHRRAAVMTVAEWMEFRFGSDRGGRAARLVAAIGVIVLVIGMMTYFCVGFGKFLDLYFGWGATTCSVVFTAIATVHILFSGLYGVVFTDVFQGVMVLFVIVYITVLAFGVDVSPETLQAGWASLGQEGMTLDQWTDITPSWEVAFPAGTSYEIYNMFGFFLFFWVLRIFLEGFGGPLVPYASQRFFAAKNDREAALTTGISMLLFVVRWPLVIGIAILGLGLGEKLGSDPEMIFPAVLSEYFPVGMRAVVVSCMVAAAMSTFDSTINAGGAYIVNDVYKCFLKPDASPKQCMRLSWWCTIGLTVVCLLLSTMIVSINDVWSWISMGLFGGMAMPFILRWYWERFNGWGYTWGTAVGISGALIQRAFWPELSEAMQLTVISSASLVASILGTYLTPPTDEATNARFFAKTRPLGYWPRARRTMDAATLTSMATEHRRDLLSIAPAITFFFLLFLCPMYGVLHQWTAVGITAAGAGVSAVVLYFTWYRHLSDEVDEPTADAPDVSS